MPLFKRVFYFLGEEVDQIITKDNWVILKKMIFSFLKQLIFFKDKQLLISLVENYILLRKPKMEKFGPGEMENLVNWVMERQKVNIYLNKLFLMLILKLFRWQEEKIIHVF